MTPVQFTREGSPCIHRHRLLETGPGPNRLPLGRGLRGRSAGRQRCTLRAPYDPEMRSSRRKRSRNVETKNADQDWTSWEVTGRAGTLLARFVMGWSCRAVMPLEAGRWDDVRRSKEVPTQVQLLRGIWPAKCCVACCVNLSETTRLRPLSTHRGGSRICDKRCLTRTQRNSAVLSDKPRPAYGSEGPGFESLQAHQESPVTDGASLLPCGATSRDFQLQLKAPPLRASARARGSLHALLRGAGGCRRAPS